MHTRMRLLKGANALLYMGPLLAGMAGLGWGIVPLFVSIFVLWLMLLRPEQWPASTAEWLTASALGAALAQVLSQLLLVALLLGTGRGVMGLAGLAPVLNPLLPLSLSIAAVILSRILWDARGAAEAGLFLDDEAEAARAPHAAAEALGVIAPLLAQSEEANETLLRGQLERLLAGPFLTHRLDALAQAIAASDRAHEALRRAVVIWATEPEIVAPGRVPNALATAFTLSNRNPDLLRLFLPRALALAAAFPDRATGFPPVATLRQAATADLDAGPNNDLPADLRADLRDGLLALARAVEAALTRTQPTAEPDPREAEPNGTHRPGLLPG